LLGEEDLQRTGMNYRRFLKDYKHVFGEKPPFSIWPLSRSGLDPRHGDPTCGACSVFVRVG
jgi:hypothetical protein